MTLDFCDPVWNLRITVPQAEPLAEEDVVYVCPLCGHEGMDHYPTGELVCPNCWEILTPFED